MSASVSPFIERRDDPRVRARTQARLQAPDAVFAQAGPAQIEEISACGLRLRTESRLHPDEALVLSVPGEVRPLHARCVWVKEGPPERHHARKTWVAGCRLQSDSIAQARLSPDPDVRASRMYDLGSRVLRMAGLLALLALLVYLYVHVATLLGGGAQVIKMR